MVKPTTCIQSSSASPTCIQSSSSQTETEYVSEINSNSNTSSGSGSSKYKGVRKRKWGKWVSEIRLPNSRERIWLGSYDSAEKAARAFDAALYCLRGRDAKFNFPENPPEIAGGSSLSPSEIQEAAARFAKEVETTAGTITSNNNNVGLDHETTSSSSASLSVESHHHRDGEMMDWSFLSTLDFTDNQLEISDYGFYSGLGHFPGDQLYPPADFFAPPPLYDDQNGDDVFSQSSFLWNF